MSAMSCAVNSDVPESRDCHDVMVRFSNRIPASIDSLGVIPVNWYKFR